MDDDPDAMIAKFISEQDQLGEEFEHVLFEHLWDLYQT